MEHTTTEPQREHEQAVNVTHECPLCEGELHVRVSREGVWGCCPTCRSFSALKGHVDQGRLVLVHPMMQA